MANGQNTARFFSLLFELIGIGAPMLNRAGVINEQASNIVSGVSAIILQEMQVLDQPQPQPSQTTVNPTTIKS